MKKKNMVSIILSVVFLGLIGYGLWVFLGSFLGISRAQRGFIESSGRIEGTEYHAATKISGRVDEIYVREGQDVKAQEKIALIYSSQLNAQVSQAEANLRKQEANFKFAEAEYQRYSRLLKDDAVAKAEYDLVENKYLLAKEDVIAFEKELERVKADLEDTKVAAPVSARVISKTVEVGEVVAGGTPIVTLVNMDELYLKVFLPTEISGKVSVGDEARIFPDAFPEEAFEAVVDKVAEKAEFSPKNVETKSQRAKLVFEIKLKIKENKNYKLKPGMPAEALIRIDQDIPWSSHR